MMTSVTRRVTGGVDTHDDIHVAAVCDDDTGRTLDTASFPTTTAGYAGLHEWMTSDAVAAARAVISGRATGTPKTRDGLTLRNQLARARRFSDNHPDLVEQQTRFALREIARRIEFLDAHNARLETRISDLVVAHCPALIGLSCVGAHSAAQLLAAAGDNPRRIRSEAAFAKLCGACPMPASSGKTNRHRLNRSGDRRANNALFTIVLNRMQRDPATRAYVERRTSEGMSKKEIMRCLKRYVARRLDRARDWLLEST